MRRRAHRLLLAAFCVLGFAESAAQIETSSSLKGYIVEVESARKARDKRFLDKKSSPLGVVAITRLDGSRVTVGSIAEANLRIPDIEVGPIHAEVLRIQNGDQVQWLLKPVDGKIVNEQSGAPVNGVQLREGDLYRLGRHFLYFNDLSTLGPVIRAFDPRAKAFDHFQGLSYFPIDPKWRVDAEIIPEAQPTAITVADTQGWRRAGWKYGHIRFQLEGQSFTLQLWVFKPDPGPEDEFLVAFRDETSGDESYGGGRYLDIPFVKSGRTILDFNRAYNPSCAYNNGFACPIPPPENRLPVPIRAGEKVFPHP